MVLKHVLTVMENGEEQPEDSVDEVPPFIRWNNDRLPIMDVSPDHPLLDTAHEIIGLFHGRLYDEEEDWDDFLDDDNDDDDHDDDEDDDDDDDNDAGEGAEANMDVN